MNIPEELKYTKDHEWISIDGEIATVGITDFAQRELGDIVYVEVETVGETLDADEVFGTVEAPQMDLGNINLDDIDFTHLKQVNILKHQLLMKKIIFPCWLQIQMLLIYMKIIH